MASNLAATEQVPSYGRDLPQHKKGYLRGGRMLAGPVMIAEWRKTRHEIVRVRLVNFNEHVILDARTWRDNGKGYEPGHGLVCSVNHLRTLASAVNDALAKAIELDLLVG
jgi:hypothetical protein